jgi:putative oxidoreductase
MDFLFLVARVLFGGYFIMNGYNHLAKGKHMAGWVASKKVPNPKLAILASGLMILLGGVGILFWSQVELSVLLIVAFLVPVTFMMHDFWKETDQMAKMNSYVGFTKNVALIGGALAFLFI